MSPTGAYYLMWHPDRPEEPQLLQSINLAMALQICILPNDGRIQWHKSLERPSMLIQVAAMEGDLNLSEVAVEYWPKSDKSKKPRGRALECFKEAFGRSYLKHEAMALSDIVRLATEEELEPEEVEEIEILPPGEEGTEITIENKVEEVPDGTGENDEVVQSGDTPKDPGGERNDGVRLGRPSWSDEKRVEQKIEREPTMEALGDPRDPDAASKRAGRGG